MIPTNVAAGPVLRIVVLAAGFSSRLGSPKALARVRGVSLLARTVRVLAPLAVSRIIVVTPPRAVRARAELSRAGLDSRVQTIACPERVRGLSASVRRAVRLAGSSAAMLLVPVDLARLERRELERLLSRWRGARRRIAACRIGGAGGTPLILPRRLYRRALGIVGDRGLRQLLETLASADRVLLDMPSAVLDVDTPEDLRRARRAPARPP